jgi:hypothetical protein
MRTDTHHRDNRYDRYDRYDRQRRATPAAIWPQPNMPAGAPNPEIYWGWSPSNQRMEMMDLPRFVEAYLSGYQQAMDQLAGAASGAAPGGAEAWSPQAWAGGRPDRERRGRGHRHHDHRHDHDHDHDHDHCGCGCDCDYGCGDHDHHGHHDHECGHDHGHKHKHDHCCDHGWGCDSHDCHCECCISDDADVVVYARCGEVRVVPIEVENDTRREREDVSFAVSEVRTAGGRQLPWQVKLDPAEPQTLEACSRTVIDLLVAVECEGRDPDTGDDKPNDQPAPSSRTAKKAAASKEATAPTRTDDRRRADVDECEVGYVTVRAEGCFIRPIVVAIAVVPKRCDAYHTGCSCSCCC